MVSVIIGAFLMLMLPGAAGPQTWLLAGEPETAETDDVDIPSDSSNDGGELVVVESGFDEYVTPHDDLAVSVGAVVENTGESMFGSASLQVRVLDDDGASLVHPREERSFMIRVPPIPPGERLAVTGSEHIADTGVATIGIEVTTPRWWSPDSPRLLGPLEADIVDIQERDDELHVTVRVESDHIYSVPRPHLCVLFRDDNGDIVGGTGLGSALSDIPPGWSEHSFTAEWTHDGDVELHIYSEDSL